MQSDNYTLVRVEERLNDVVDSLREIQNRMGVDLTYEIDELELLIEMVNDVANSDDDDYIFDLDRD